MYSVALVASRPTPLIAAMTNPVAATGTVGLLIAASDADTAGRRHAGPPGGTEAAARFAAILPPEGLNDWNDALRALTPAL